MANIFRYVGIGKETTFGGAVDGTIFLDPSSCSLDSPQNPEIVVEGGMGRMAARKRPGFYACSGGVTYPVDINSMGYLMRGALDQYAFTAGDPNNTHEFYGGNLNVLPSWTYRLGKDVHEQYFTGCMINSLKLSVSDNLATASVDLLGRRDYSTTLKDYSQFADLIPTAYPLAFYDVTATVNDVDSSAICRSAEISINNNLGKDSGRGLGSMHPATFKAGTRLVEITMELQFDDLKHQTLFWGSADGPSCDGSTLFPLCLEFDGGTDGEMEMSMPNCMMNSITTQPSGREVLYQSVICTALMAEDVALADASTVNTDILVTLLNAGATLA